MLVRQHGLEPLQEYLGIGSRSVLRLGVAPKNTKSAPSTLGGVDFSVSMFQHIKTPSLMMPAVFLYLLLATVFSAGASTRSVWGKAELDLPESFFGNYSYNTDSRQEEFIFGVGSSSDVFGWIERAPKRFNRRPQREVLRHLKSSLRSEGYRMVAKTEQHVRGRWRADFTGRSRGASYRRQVTILPVREGYFIVTVSSPRGKWGSSLSRRMRAVAEKIRAL